MTNLFKSIVIATALCVVSVAGFAESGGKTASSKEQITKEVDTNKRLLLNAVLAKAKNLHDTFGHFAPFGAALFPDGKVHFVWVAKPGDGVKNPAEAILVLRKTLQAQAQAGRILGSAIGYTYVPEKAKSSKEHSKKQLNVELEYISGEAWLTGISLGLDKDLKLQFGKVIEKPSQVVVFRPAEVKAPKK